MIKLKNGSSLLKKRNKINSSFHSNNPIKNGIAKNPLSLNGKLGLFEKTLLPFFFRGNFLVYSNQMTQFLTKSLVINEKNKNTTGVNIEDVAPESFEKILLTSNKLLKKRSKNAIMPDSFVFGGIRPKINLNRSKFIDIKDMGRLRPQYFFN